MNQSERDRLVITHRHLVTIIANSLRGRAREYRIDEDDLIQQGNLGLIRAADAWGDRLAEEVEFVRFAWTWIKGSMCRLFRHAPTITNLDAERYWIQEWDPVLEMEGLPIEGAASLPLLLPFWPRWTCAESHLSPMPDGCRDVCLSCHESGYDRHPAMQPDPRRDPKPDERPKLAKVSDEVKETRRQRRARIFGRTHPGIAHAS
jgi:hypothetical protein